MEINDCLKIQNVNNKNNENLEAKEKPSTKCCYWLMDHYDSVVRQIDLFVEGLLEKRPNGNDERLQKRRQEVIEQVRELERQVRTSFVDNRDEWDRCGDSIDEVDLKKRLFGNMFCFVVKLSGSNDGKPKKLVLIIDSFVGQNDIDNLENLINCDLKHWYTYDKTFQDDQLNENAIDQKSTSNEEIEVICSKQLSQQMNDIKLLIVQEKFGYFMYFGYDFGFITDFFLKFLNEESVKSEIEQKTCNLSRVQNLVLNDHVEENVFKNLESLRYLILVGPRLERPCSNVFSHLTNLKCLYIKYMSNTNEDDKNVLDELTFAPLVNLEELFIRQSKNLKRITRCLFRGLSKLKLLSLGHNGICEIDDFAFESLSNLNILHLDRNDLNKFGSNILAGLDKLEELAIDYHTALSVPASALPNSLKTLDIACLYAQKDLPLPDSLFDRCNSRGIKLFREII